MRNRVLILVGLLGGGLCRAPAHAQVTFNPSALEPLHPPAATSPAPTPDAAASTPAAWTSQPPPRRAAPSSSRTQASTKQAEPDPSGKIGIRRGTEQFGPPRPPQVTAGTLVVPAAPPPAVVIPPPIAVPVRPPPPPIPVVVDPKAEGAVAALTDGTRITFGRDSSDLNPATEAAIKAVPHAPAAASAETTFDVTAFATGTPEDPSTARRLSLARALQVRAVLMEQGVPSVRIYVKALGSTVVPGPDAPRDRVDLTFSAPPAAPPPPPAATAQAVPPHAASPKARTP